MLTIPLKNKIEETERIYKLAGVKMIELLPSVLAADFARLEQELKLVEKCGVKMLHIDVMDGMFVPSISLGMPVIEAMRRVAPLFFDVHLMVEEPGRYVKDFADCGADSISVHAEACRHLHRTIGQIREAGKQACVVLNPSTGLSELKYVLQDVDTVLLMTVDPGFGGQKYIPSMTGKIRELKAMIDRENPGVHIMVDGGIKLDNVQEVLEAGADRIVAGSSVFGVHTAENIRAFQEIFNNYYIYRKY